MESAPQNPDDLPAGTRLGPWRLVRRLGHGAFGTVYLVEAEASQPSGRAALKLALAPQDARFAREAELLSRLHHPCVPRFLGQGDWLFPWGRPHPFVVMEWIDGMRLYDWARLTSPSSWQLLQLLAGVAGALAATHAAGGLHRDVKGDNILVRLHDGQPFLADFGSGHFLGAGTLTHPPFPPGTPFYRSPEALRHAHGLLGSRAPLIAYAPTPADDVFALGVTAWHLVTGEYPPPPDPREAHPFWDWDGGGGPRLAAQALNARCSPELGVLIARMLSVRPEARGSAAELAAQLEAAARAAGLGADAPFFPTYSPDLGSGQKARSPTDMDGEDRRGYSRRVAASLSVALTLAVVGLLKLQDWRGASWRQPTDKEEDAGTVGLGDQLLTAPVSPEQAPPGWSTIGMDLPSTPLPGQIRPDAKGRCPSMTYVAINGGCWKKVEEESPGKCAAYDFRYKGACFMPVTDLTRPPMSSPTDAPDSGAR